ncbi:MAG: hypothetical protein RR571_05235 [Anaerorhabdus sp.]|jgi:hypothetical protein
MKKKPNSKIELSFYKHIFRLFLVFLAIGSFFLGLLWVGLDYYESVTPNGALVHYTQLVKDGKFEEIYEESTKVYLQYNEKDEYINYLEKFYSNVDMSKAAFTKTSYSTSEYQYYEMSVDGETIATLELKKDPKKNKWNVRTLTDARSFTIETDLPDIEMSINNYPIEKDRIRQENVTAHAFNNLDNIELSPLINQYYIDNLVGVPTITTANSNYVVVKNATEDIFYAGTKPSDSEMVEYKQLIENVAETYCMYITEDVTFATLRKLLYTKTSFYDAIRSFDNSFFSTHDRIEFGDMNVFDVVEIGDDGLIASVSFDYIVYIGDRSQTYSNTYQMSFLNINENWLLTNLVIAESN